MAQDGTAEDSALVGRTAVVTGAAGTIGGWIADAFARRSANLVLSDRRIDRLQVDAERGRWPGVEVALHATELRDPASVAALVALVAARHGAPDALVNNAGIYPYRPLLDVDLREWQAVLDTNLTAAFQLILGMGRLMIAQSRSGSIVNIVSSKATTVSRDTVAYSVSKAALAMLTRGAALELAPYGIRVNGVAPGFAPGSEVSALSEEYVGRVLQAIPLGRASGPLDAPEMVVYLCSERASFITGAIIPVDGGRLAGPITL